MTAQALAQILVRRQGRAAVASRREARHQAPVSAFVQRVDGCLAPGPAHRYVLLAVAFRRRRTRLEQLAQSLAVRSAGLVRPLVVEPCQQLAFAERERHVQPARVDQLRELAESAQTSPSSAISSRLVTSWPAAGPTRAAAQKSRCAGSAGRSHRGRRARSGRRGPPAGADRVEREVGQQRPSAPARRCRQRLAVDFDAHRAQHAHLQHERERSCASRAPAND